MLALSCIQKIECSGSTRCLFCELQIQSISIYFLKSKTISIFAFKRRYLSVSERIKVSSFKGMLFIWLFTGEKNRAAIG
ncbi:hypothetical protein S7A_17545 [Pantoea sp. Sc1]|nr:hypothetical protein S7A_17545 [Pantoea sp. Sc1]